MMAKQPGRAVSGCSLKLWSTAESGYSHSPLGRTIQVVIWLKPACLFCSWH